MKKRALSLLMALVMVVSLLPATVRAADSTLNGDISVGTATDLAALGGKDIVGNITLTADNIDMSGTAMTPIKSLKGCFNGDGKTISGLTLKGGTGKYGSPVNTGLIGELNGSIVNLNLDNVTIIGNATAYGSSVGSLVGKIEVGSVSKIDNCTVSGMVSSAGSGAVNVGGLVGYMTDNNTKLTIHNCVSNVVLSGASSNYVGGLVGSAQTNATLSITKCAQLSGRKLWDCCDYYARGRFENVIGIRRILS